MRSTLVMALLVAGLTMATRADAQEEQPPAPTVAFEISPKLDTYYVGQRVTAKLSIDFGEAELVSQIGTAGLPDATTAQLSEFRQVDSGNPQKLVFSATMVILKRGLSLFAPELSGQVAVRMQSAGFIRKRIYPFRASATPVELHVEVPPELGRPANDCGAVGEYKLAAELSPTSCVVGDLLTLKWTLVGNGTADDVTKVEYKPGKDFRVYPPRVTSQADGVISCSQVIIPLNTNVTSAAAFSLSVFNPLKGEYTELVSGPFKLKVAERAMNEAPTNTLSGLVYRNELEEAPPQTGETSNGWMRFLHRNRGEQTPLSVTSSARLCPDAVSQILFEIPAGSTVEIRERHGDWARVLHDGAAGWISAAVMSKRE